MKKLFIFLSTTLLLLTGCTDNKGKDSSSKEIETSSSIVLSTSEEVSISSSIESISTSETSTSEIVLPWI